MSRVSGLAERIRLRVLRGELAPGEWLVEVQLARAYEVSRWTIREALRLLEGRGLLDADADGGMRVIAPTAGAVAEALEVRAALEGLSAGLAADRGITAADLDALRTLAARPRPADARAALLEDRTLHRALDALAGNAVAHDALDRAWDVLVVGAAGSTAHAEHHRLVELVAAGEPEVAAAAVRQHALESGG